MLATGARIQTAGTLRLHHFLPPHQWGTEREKLAYPCWAYDYATGRLAVPDEILHRYAMWRVPSTRRKVAKKLIAQAETKINAANVDERHWVRIMLGMPFKTKVVPKLVQLPEAIAMRLSEQVCVSSYTPRNLST